MLPPDPLEATHPDVGSVRLLPYGQGRWLADVAGPHAVRLLHAAAVRGHPEWHARPGWSSLLLSADDGCRLLADLVSLPLTGSSDRPPTRVAIDVVYDGVDLPAVAEFCGLTVDEVISRHSASTYEVVFLGFTRGCAYLDGLDPVLAAVPRLPTPRVRVPAGSLGIAAGQTGIYPMDSPGGWHLLGRTTIGLFDPERMPPSLVAPGDVVNFRAVR